MPEMPGCSLCMGNQAQIRKGSTAISTSTRNFPTASASIPACISAPAELAAMCALARPHRRFRNTWSRSSWSNRQGAADVYRYMNFDQIRILSRVAETVTV